MGFTRRQIGSLVILSLIVSDSNKAYIIANGWCYMAFVHLTYTHWLARITSRSFWLCVCVRACEHRDRKQEAGKTFHYKNRTSWRPMHFINAFIMTFAWLHANATVNQLKLQAKLLSLWPSKWIPILFVNGNRICFVVADLSPSGSCMHSKNVWSRVTGKENAALRLTLSLVQFESFIALRTKNILLIRDFLFLFFR